ncbi:DUF6221 family protein [Kitasatospora sp. RB6PN24]|uniref:DUF6221 family protein n=1 Tax=Kitasatospora humi TaxID=2893891 RepID=UPI001E61DF54|nr:DUF6221 family protein [Kitasatospora humi]MCC9307711.1 DUF6221 family protein [Kitasatospora humi]
MSGHPALAFLRQAHEQAEELARAAGGDRWRPSEYPAHDSVAVYDSSDEAVVYAEGAPTDEEAQHIALHDPAAVLRRVASERELLADLLAERHLVVEDPWYSCSVATEERDGGECRDGGRLGGPCDCGRDERVERRVLLLAEAWDWTA